MPKFISYVGRKFGKLTVVERVPNTYDGVTWKCMCDCGNEKTASAKNLRRGDTISCGCAYKDAADRREPKHGHSRRGKVTTEHNSWNMMLDRCLNPNGENYADYMGRGITVCDEWRDPVNGFQTFINDMGPKPSIEYSIERRDNEKGYRKDNCFWADKATQNRNRRSTVFIEHEGKRLCLTDWEKELRLGVGAMHHRVKNLRERNQPLHLAIYHEHQSISERYGPIQTGEIKKEDSAPEEVEFWG